MSSTNINRDMRYNLSSELQNKRHHKAMEWSGEKRNHIKGRHARCEIAVHPLRVGEMHRLSIVYKSRVEHVL